MFSKYKSNVLFLNQLYDYKIILKGENKKTLKYNPVYKMLLEQFELIKEYITNNLAKKFIEFS